MLSGTRSEPRGRPGATLVGYAHGAFSMGEVTRSTADALATTDVPFGLFDVNAASEDVPDPLNGRFPAVSTNEFAANIFHVNADQMLQAYCRIGPQFFRNRYNIGYWLWELSKWPEAWIPVIDLVDELWAPSTFIQNCLREVTDKPVTLMPMRVDLPTFDKLPRSRFGLPDGDCLFIFAFDFRSYIERKNPFAAIRAFKQAFPLGTERAGLVVKVMKADEDSDRWQEMLRAIDGDARIHVINDVMSRGELLALLDACDCFVSLHRSEGFGFGPAEAMYLGKPVIVTNYSGNIDFTRPGASLLVDYELVPVGPGEYVFGEGQSWADADVDDAARQMRRVQQGDPEVSAIARRGQAIVRNELSSMVVGQNIRRRLQDLGLLSRRTG
jgi:glycosyltransferase involved in cell wall biosynthesis